MNMKRPKTVVIGLGGSTLIRSSEKRAIEEQYVDPRRTSERLLELLRAKIVLSLRTVMALRYGISY